MMDEVKDTQEQDKTVEEFKEAMGVLPQEKRELVGSYIRGVLVGMGMGETKKERNE